MKKAKNYLRHPYARVVIPVEPNSFHAEILEFPGCFAQGETVEKAYANLEIAAESWIDSCLARGQEVPQPSSSLTYSGRIAFRLPRSIHRRAAQLAERDASSLNTFLVSAVAEKVGAEDLYSALATRLEQRLSVAAFEAYADSMNTSAPTFMTNVLNKIDRQLNTSESQPVLVTSGRRV